MSKSANSFKREKKIYRAEPTVLAICEDKKSSKNYLTDVSKHFRVNMDIVFDHCGKTDPLGIVNEAIANQRYYDKVFCVIDRDDHSNFDEAIALAKRHKKITVITSYPCFEFWLILHFGHCARPFRAAGKKSAADLAVDFLRTKPNMSEYAKGNIGLFASLPTQRFDDARRISPRILQQAMDSGELNPSTEIHLIINEMEDLSEPRRV